MENSQQIPLISAADSVYHESSYSKGQNFAAKAEAGTKIDVEGGKDMLDNQTLHLVNDYQTPPNVYELCPPVTFKCDQKSTLSWGHDGGGKRKFWAAVARSS
ncbi:hypothetical protein ACJJTC_006150 [Scirpophaga incertulas]